MKQYELENDNRYIHLTVHQDKVVMIESTVEGTSVIHIPLKEVKPKITIEHNGIKIVADKITLNGRVYHAESNE